MLSVALGCLAFSAGPVVQQRGALSARRASVPLAMAKGNDAIDFPELDGTDMRIGIIQTRWHKGTGDALISGVKKALAECKVDPENIIEYEVPGAFELPLAARYMALSGSVDAIIPVGVLIEGARPHGARACARALAATRGCGHGRCPPPAARRRAAPPRPLLSRARRFQATQRTSK